MSPSHSHRTLVLCFDGTSDSYDDKNSNVVKFFATLCKENVDKQLCYYQSGVGTYENPGITTPLAMWLTKKLDEMVAFYLNAHVMGGYSFLMENYRPGDKVCLFGFSRGAYTARALAGFLTKVGLLPRGNVEQVQFAYRLFKKSGEKNDKLAEGFKSQFCLPIEIEFLGVWDTVASTGWFYSKYLPFTSDNNAIKTFRHALALDERRVRFEPTYYHATLPPWAFNNIFNVFSNMLNACNPWSRKNNKRRDTQINIANDVKEVWFVGNHGDVGGGWDSNNTLHSLANVPLKWMIREVIESGCGIRFNDDALETFHINRRLPPAQYFGLEQIFPDNGTDEENKYRIGSEDSASPLNARSLSYDPTIDALQQRHDILKSWWSPWWILEMVPNIVTWQDTSGEWLKCVELHRGRKRHVNQLKQLYFHKSVEARERYKGYIPKVTFDRDKMEYTW